MRADYPRVTHPCATLLRAEAPFAFDLHVLSTPPAFNLSQNQTLQFKSVPNLCLAEIRISKFFPLAIHLSMNNRLGHPLSARRSYLPSQLVCQQLFSPPQNFFRNQSSRPKRESRFYAFGKQLSTVFFSILTTNLCQLAKMPVSKRSDDPTP